VPLLRLFGVRRDQCSAGELWRHISDVLERAGAQHVPIWRAPLGHILTHGTLARRLLRAAGPMPDRATLCAVYTALCDCLEAGRAFIP
jgi:hypothetical protein